MLARRTVRRITRSWAGTSLKVLMAARTAACKMSPMTPDQATAAGVLSVGAHSAPQVGDRVVAEQLKLLCQQWVRLPVPIALVCAYVAYLVWGYIDAAVVLGWAGATVAVVAVRALLLARYAAGTAMNPQVWARRMQAFALLSGAVSGAAAPLFFGALPLDHQAVLTMVLCCLGAGGIATSGAYPRAYYSFALPYFAQIAVVWLKPGAPDAWFISFLLIFFLVVMVIFVRDNGRMVVESIRLRFANEELLAQKEHLIELLRTEFDKAESARTKAEQANRSKSQFLASASHDLRQPLHALSLLTALLKEASADSHVREVGRHIDQSVQSLDRLFGALLDLSKLDAGVMKIDLRDLNLTELLEHLSIEYRPKAQEKSLAFQVDCPPLWLRTDPMQLERIVRNLLENAIRFTSAGRVGISVRRSGADALITVTDTGPGIPPAEQDRVFEEFYQLHNPGRDRSKGLGLGLSIVRRLVDLLGYRIELHSVLAHGTRFTLTLPGAVVEPPGKKREQAAPRAANVSGLRVLVIEDDAEARRAIDLTLTTWRCEPLMASSLEEAETLLRERGNADVIVSDVRLGNGASGIDAIDALRKEFGQMPAALVTGDIAAQRLLELRASGLPVLHKPVKADALRELLHQLAEAGRA
jgi:signal transduction histidine kinase